MEVFGSRHNLADNVFSRNGPTDNLVISRVLRCRSCRELKVVAQPSVPTDGLVEQRVTDQVCVGHRNRRIVGHADHAIANRHLVQRHCKSRGRFFEQNKASFSGGGPKCDPRAL